MKGEIGVTRDASEFAVPEDRVSERRLVVGGRCEGLGRREDEFVWMFPPEAAGYLRFEFDVLCGIPLIDEGVGDKGLVEPEGEVTEWRHFIFGVGIVETDGAAVAGEDDGKGYKQKKAVRPERLGIRGQVEVFI